MAPRKPAANAQPAANAKSAARATRRSGSGRRKAKPPALQPTPLWQALLGASDPATAEPSQAQSPIGVFVAEMSQLLAACGVAPTPTIVLRVHDVATTLTIALALEDPLLEGLAAGEQMPSAAVESAAKARERWRKAMKELEDSCARAGSPIDQGLPDEVRPLLRKAEGVLDAALTATRSPDDDAAERPAEDASE